MDACHPLRKALETNSVADSFTAKVPTATKPSNVGVFDLLGAALGLGFPVEVPKFAQLMPFGSAAENVTFDMRLWGWSKTTDHSPVWVPQLLGLFAVTLGNIAATPFGANNFLADTIVVTKGANEASGSGSSVISTAGDTTASVLVGLRGCELIEFDFDKGTATDSNCLWRITDRD
jgi:hypothetical protein